MDVYLCDSCGLEAKKKKPDSCPLCHGTEFTKSTREDPGETDKREDALLDAAIAELDKYDEGTEHRDPTYAYRCPCSEHAKTLK